MRSSRVRRLFLVWLIGWTFAAACPVGAAEKMVFSLNWLPYGLHFGVYAAVEQGYYRDAKLDFDILRGQGSGDTVKRVALGSAVFGMADAASVILGRAKGMAVKQIGMVLDRSADAVYFLKGSGIASPKDLEGRTMGAAAGETPLTLFPAFASGAGLDPKKVHWVNMTPPSKIATLVSKKVDTIITFTTEEPLVRAATQKAGLEFGRFLYSDFGVDYYSIGLIARDQTIQEQPDLVRRFVDATIRGYAWAIENPEGAADAFVKNHKESSRALQLDQWKVVAAHMVTPMAREKGLGSIDAGKMGRTVELIKRFYSLERDVTADEVYTMKLLPRITAKGM